MKVLVTGATGFVGRHVLGPLVELGHQVHAVTRPGLETPDSDVTWHHVDLLTGGADFVRTLAPEGLIHLAWYAQHRLFWTSLENLRWVAATSELLRAFVEARGKRFVGVGTCAEYDWAVPAETLREDAPLAPSTLYGCAKDVTRRLVESTASLSGFSWAWARLFFLYGPGEHPDRFVASIARALAAGQPAPMSHGRQVRDFMHTSEAGRAIAQLFDAPVIGPVNVGTGEAHTLAEIASVLAELAGRPDGLILGATKAAANEPPRLVANVEKLRSTGFTPRRTLHQGLEGVWRSHSGLK